MCHNVPSVEILFGPLDAPSSGIHVRDHCTYYLHDIGPNHSTSLVIPWPSSWSFQSAEQRSFLFQLIGHTIYMPSSLITSLHRSFHNHPLGHFSQQNNGHFGSSWSNILSTFHCAKSFHFIGHFIDPICIISSVDAWSMGHSMSDRWVIHIPEHHTNYLHSIMYRYLFNNNHIR